MTDSRVVTIKQPKNALRLDSCPPSLDAQTSFIASPIRFSRPSRLVDSRDIYGFIFIFAPATRTPTVVESTRRNVSHTSMMANKTNVYGPDTVAWVNQAPSLNKS